VILDPPKACFGMLFPSFLGVRAIGVWLTFRSLLASPAVLGHSLLPLFALERNYTNLNHGSYGATPLPVLQAEREWQDVMERNPDQWFRFDGPKTLIGAADLARARVAEYVKADARDVVFVDGASAGVNAVLRSINLPPHSSILYLNTAYQMVKNTISYVNGERQQRSVQVNISVPSSKSEILEAVQNALDSNPSVELASFSHITSVPAILLPVEELVQICHQKGIMVLIDGAHALGQIPLNIPKTGADFYVANGHKWLYSPKGSAILWVARDKQHLIHPNVISDEGKGLSFFQLQFSYTGTKDYSAFLAMSAALEFREALGGDARILDYVSTLAVEGGQRLAEALGTEPMPTGGLAMVNVPLPPQVAMSCCDMKTAQRVLLKHRTFVPFYLWQGQCFVRVSAQVYNEVSDFVHLAGALQDVLQHDCFPSEVDI